RAVSRLPPLHLKNEKTSGAFERPAACEKQETKAHEAGRPSELVHDLREVEGQDGERKDCSAGVNPLASRLLNTPRGEAHRTDHPPEVDGPLANQRTKG